PERHGRAEPTRGRCAVPRTRWPYPPRGPEWACLWCTHRDGVHAHGVFASPDRRAAMAPAGGATFVAWAVRYGIRGLATAEVVPARPPRPPRGGPRKPASRGLHERPPPPPRHSR